MNTVAKGAPHPHPVLPPQRLGRQWTGVTACPCHALARAAAVTLATTASSVIRARVPSVYRSFGCQDGSWGVVWVTGGLLGAPKHFERDLGQGPRGLRGYA